MVSFKCREFARADNVQIDDVALKIIYRLSRYMLEPPSTSIRGIHVHSPMTLGEYAEGAGYTTDGSEVSVNSEVGASSAGDGGSGIGRGYGQNAGEVTGQIDLGGGLAGGSS